MQCEAKRAICHITLHSIGGGDRIICNIFLKAILSFFRKKPNGNSLNIY